MLIESLAQPLYHPLTESGTRAILDTAFRVLDKRGVHIHSAEVLDRFRRAGAEIDENAARARLPRSLVEDAIDSNPSVVTLCSRDGRNDAVLGNGRVHYGTGGTAIYVLDVDTGERRPSRIDDLILNARLIQALDYIHLTTINVFPNEIENRDDVDVNRFFHSMDHMTKHVMGGVYSLAGCKKVVRMAERIAGSPEALRDRPFVSFITLVVSPLRIDGHYGEITSYLAEQNLPVVVPTMPICGLTCPITLASNVMMCVAETLAGIVLVQSARKGAPGICGSAGAPMNLQSMLHVGGCIERAMIQAAVAQVIQRVRLPFYSTAGTTDAKGIDAQAVYESAVSNLLVAMSGADYIHDSAGLLESELTVSYDKLAIDNEVLGMCNRVLRGIEVTDESLAAGLIIERGPQDHFAAEEHTMLHMHTEFYQPTLANRDKREVMQPGQDAETRARRFVESIRQSQPESKLDPSIRDAILKEFPEIRFPV
jgi:trimethylamine--corrinoid protein Co-methyltransferase